MHLVGIYMTSITKMHGTMNMKCIYCLLFRSKSLIRACVIARQNAARITKLTITQQYCMWISHA